MTEGLMTVDDVAQYLNVSVHSVYKMTSRKEIPFVKIGSLVRFRKVDIDRWILRKVKNREVA